MYKLVLTKNEDYVKDTNVVAHILENHDKSDIKNNMKQILKKYNIGALNSIYEDLLIIGMSIFFGDKNFSRENAYDRWTREIDITIPVINIEKWTAVKEQLEKTLNFLSGDIWKLHFSKTDKVIYKNSKTDKKVLNNERIDGISLFSGGLDSFCGAINLLEKNKNIIFVGFQEYKQLAKTQNNLFDLLKNNYSNCNIHLQIINNSIRKKCFSEKMNDYSSENTSRSRSFLFLCYAIAIAGIKNEYIPVYIPENGFVGINVPMTESRIGSCSTRTTHPFFLKNLNEILSSVNINNKVENFFSTKTKKEIVNLSSSTKAFKDGYSNTISCSHPCSLSMRRDKIRTPCNCGYCYPCLIRRASLIDTEADNNNYGYNLNMKLIDTTKTKDSDLLALLHSIYKYQLNTDLNIIRSKIRKVAQISSTDIENYARIYNETMLDMIKLLNLKEEFKELKEYADIK